MKPSGSKLALLPDCRYFARPDVPWDEDETGEPARFGNAGHYLCEATVRGDVLSVDAACDRAGVKDPEDRARLVRVWAVALDYITERKRLGWLPEMAIAWDWVEDTARTLDTTHHRDYSKATASEVCCTLDVATMDGDVAVVRDWKFGRSDLDGYAEQAKVQAIGLARVTGATIARAIFTKFDEEGAYERVWEWRTPLALDAAAHDLSQWLTEAATGKPEPRPGRHCTEHYCPAFEACPATKALIASSPETAPLTEVLTTAIATPQDAARAYLASKRAKAFLKLVDDRVKEVVTANGGAIPSTYGKVLKMLPQSREYFSAERIDPEERDEVLQDLRGCGALKKSEWVEMREVKA